jgi:hypothetical protein
MWIGKKLLAQEIEIGGRAHRSFSPFMACRHCQKAED